MKIKLIVQDCRCKYEGQEEYQGVVADLHADGKLYIGYNPEIGNAIPCDVWNGKVQRFTVTGNSKAEAREWYKSNKEQLLRVLEGMGEKYNGNNYVGTLTDEAREAVDEISYSQYA